MVAKAWRPYVALAFIAMLGGNEAIVIQRNSAGVVALAGVLGHLHRAMGVRSETKSCSVTAEGESSCQQGEQQHETLEETSEGINSNATLGEFSCDSDVMLEYWDGNLFGQKKEVRIWSNQYKNAGDKGFVVAFKVEAGPYAPPPDRACAEMYSIVCNQQKASWRKERVATCTSPGVEVKAFTEVAGFGAEEVKLEGTNTDQKFDVFVKSNMNAIQFQGDPFSDEPRKPSFFPPAIRVIKAWGAGEACGEIDKEQKAAEEDLAGMLNGLCDGTSGPQLGNCVMSSAPPSVDKFVLQVSSYMSSTGTAKKKCGKSAGEMKQSPVMRSLKDLYKKMNSGSESKFDNAVDQINPGTGFDLDEFAKQLMKDTNVQQQLEEAAKKAPAPPVPINTDKAEDAAAELQSQASAMQSPGATFADMEGQALQVKTTRKSLIEVHSAMQDGSGAGPFRPGAIDLWAVLGWAVAIAAVVVLVYFLIVLLIAILVWIFANILTLLAIFLVLWAVVAITQHMMCSKMASSGQGLCAGYEKQFYRHVANNRGLPANWRMSWGQHSWY